MKLLYLNNMNDNLWPARLDKVFHENGLEVELFWANHNQFPDSIEQYDCVFLSGSVNSPNDNLEWIIKEHELIRAVAQNNTPVLGICFGSQILATALCGREQVFRREECEVGYVYINMNHSSIEEPLLMGVGDKVHMFVWHNDEVRADHSDMVILGSSDSCPNQIWRYKDKPIWGIQGHPELNREQVLLTYQIYRKDFTKDGADIQKLEKQEGNNLEGKKIISNFMKYCLDQFS